MADQWRGDSPDSWSDTWEGEILDIIYGHYKKALDVLPLEEMPSLAPRLLDAGVCFGFADPVTNIIVNTLSFCEPNGAATKRKRGLKTKASDEARSREEVLSKIVAGDNPSPPEARTVAERSLEGLVTFLTSYFRYLPTWDALRYLNLARADLLVAVSLTQKDRCYWHNDQLQVCSPAVKNALKCAALSARQPDFAGFFTGSYALVSRINIITQKFSAEGCHHHLTIQDIFWFFELLTKPLKLKRTDRPMKLASKRFCEPEIIEINGSMENVPGQLTDSLRGVLMDRIHEHYLEAVSRFPMKDLQTHHHRGLLKAGYSFGPFDPVSNIIVNTVWYDTTFPASKEFKVDMIRTLRHVETRSVNGLIAFVCACFPMISEHKAMIYLLKSDLDVGKTIQIAKSGGCDASSVCGISGYKAAAKAASHPNPEAYCEFVLHSLFAVRSKVRSLLQPSHMLASAEILHLSTFLSLSSVKSLEPTIQLTKDALKTITEYEEDFLTQQSFVRRKVEAALRNYEQTKACHYNLGAICGVNDRVGKKTGFCDTNCPYTHANFWASQDNGTVKLFFIEFVNDEASDCKPRCYPVSGLSTQEVRCCYCEFQGNRIVHPIENCWEGASDFEKIAYGEHCCFTNAEIVSRAKLIDHRLMGMGNFVQDYIYLDPAQDAELIIVVNHDESLQKLDLNAEMRRRKRLCAADNCHPQQASFLI